MITLNKAKKNSAKILKWTIISIIMIIILSILVKPFDSIKNAIFTKEETPKAEFGKLPQIIFPQAEKKVLKYSIDTISGFLPTLPNQAKVYKIISAKPSLTAFDRTKERISRIGFTAQGSRISEDTYRWIDNDSFSQTIIVNIFSSDFTFRTSYLTMPDMNTFIDSKERDEAKGVAQSFLSEMSLFKEDIDFQKTKTSMFNIENNILVPATSISNTRIVKVDFFQKDIGNLPIFYEKESTSNISLLVGKQAYDLKVIEADYSYKNISKEFSTYPLKTPDQAFLELKQGDAYILSKPEGSNAISITGILPGYYIGKNNQDFMMPIFIFQGRNGFTAYVPAIQQGWINN